MGLNAALLALILCGMSLIYKQAAAMSSFSSPKTARVAVIGGGISGLSCASHLSGAGLDVVVFDTGKRSIGGRVSSRNRATVGDKTIILDHSAQFIGRPQTPDFAKVIGQMLNAGCLQEWKGSLGVLQAGDFKCSDGSSGDGKAPGAYAGVGGMNSVAQYLGEGIAVERPVWVSKMKRVEASSPSGNGHWELFEYQKPLGKFDFIVIAHNGKCADRLLSTAGVPSIHNLLKVKFGPRLPAPPRRATQMQLCSLWVASVIFKQSVGAEYEGAVVAGSSVLSWISNTSKKVKQPVESTGGREVWTLISTRDFGANNKVTYQIYNSV